MIGDDAAHDHDARRDDTAVRVRESLARVPAYVPGKRATNLDAFKVSSNENPYPPLESVLAAISDAARDVNRYPDLASLDLTAALARTFEVHRSEIVLGTGSVAVLAYLAQALIEPGDEMVYAWRSFEAYPVIAGVLGAKAVDVPLTPDFRHDLPAMAAAITDRTRLVIVCSPNNPTGPTVRTDELDEFLLAIPDRVVVVLDEAYLEFVADWAAPDGLEFFARHANLAVLRTFSKAYGLAGLRVGYALAHEPLAGAMRKIATPFGVSSLAQAAALASLTEQAVGELGDRVDHLIAERERVVADVRALVPDLPDAQGNFLFLPFGDRSAAFAAFAAERGLVVRPYGDDGVRVTIGEDAANVMLLPVVAEFLA